MYFHPVGIASRANFNRKAMQILTLEFLNRKKDVGSGSTFSARHNRMII